MSSGWMSRGMLVAALFAALAVPAEGQRRRGWDGDRDRDRDRHHHHERPRAFLDLSFMSAEPDGEFAQFVDDGWGFQIAGRFSADPYGIMSIRTDFGFINYGHERIRGCSFTCRAGIDVTTTNNILFAGIGPELAIPAGPVRMYAGVQGGVGYFVTTSSYEDAYYRSSDTNFDDAVFQWRGRGGMQFQLSGGRAPVYLDLGAQYHHNGLAEYVLEGDVVDEPNGDVTIYTTYSEANLWTVQIGLSIGLASDH